METATKIRESIPITPIAPDLAAATELEKASEATLDAAIRTKKALDDYYPALVEATEPQITDREVNDRLEIYKRTAANLKKAQQITSGISDELSARWKDIRRCKKKNLIPPAPANAIIDAEESRTNHFAKGLSPYKLLLLCFIGSFFGVLIELGWCLLTRGHLESRSGLVYGPFNLLYGVGAVALSVSLYRFRNRGKWLSFLGGAVVGSVVEYACSFFQELAFGSRSWDYSKMPFNINGRICLLYSLFWGILGVLWVKSIYPRMAKLILKIPDRAGKVITWILTAFFIVNAVVTCIAVFRWSERIQGVAATNGFWQFIDSRFTDERMGRIFANMKY